ncbi:MAG: hypothetical protein J6575_01350 [Bifidobacterium sp.]|nr:hypothetical protein [Bifidobacterium sp.]
MSSGDLVPEQGDEKSIQIVKDDNGIMVLGDHLQLKHGFEMQDLARIPKR